MTNFVVNEFQMGMGVMKRRSIVVGGHKTSVSLEDDFWGALKKIALRHRATLSDLVGSIDSQRQHGNLSSAVRLFVLTKAASALAYVELLMVAKVVDQAVC